MTSSNRKVTVMPEYRGVSLKDVPVESDLFKGMKFSERCGSCHLTENEHGCSGSIGS